MNAILMALLLAPTEEVAAKPAEPIGDPGSWITSIDYPAAALQSEMAGITGVRMHVSRAGMVDGCTIVESSGADILDDLSCNLLKLRARYRPARDARGQPVATTVDKRIRWQIPDGDAVAMPRLPRIEPFSLIVDFDLSAAGEVENCKVTWAAGLPPEAAAMCATIETMSHQPALGPDGQPIARHYTFRTSMTLDDVQPAAAPVPAAPPPEAAPPTRPKNDFGAPRPS